LFAEVGEGGNGAALVLNTKRCAAKTEEAKLVIRRETDPVGEAHETWVVVPRATAHHATGATRRSLRIIQLISAPLPHIACHIIESELIGLETSDRCSIWISIVIA